MITLDQLEHCWDQGDGPWLSHQWRVLEFPTIGGLKLDPVLCEEIVLPLPTFGERDKSLGSGTISLAATSSAGQLEMVFGLDNKFRALKYLNNWEHLIQNPYTGGFRLPSVYMKEISVGYFSGDGTQVARGVCRNAWPTTYSGIGGDRVPADKPINASFKVTAFYWEWL
jgi:hypothetical protein